ncbi:MAG: protoglobin family protein [Planctomycetaceae bacterium]|nr:protoglobin family protein [Planctomycetaceae bacterium]
MIQIDEARLESDVAYRVDYLSQFMGFDGQDIAAIHGAAGALAPLVPGLVDAVYVKLFSYDATKRHFVPRQSGYDGPVPASLAELNLDHAMIEFRKGHLSRYLVALVTRPYDAKMIHYLDLVGKMHTPQAGSAELDVPLVQMNALMGFVADALTATILSLGLDRATEERTVRAFNKLLWLQNDLITRHYQGAQQVESGVGRPHHRAGRPAAASA